MEAVARLRELPEFAGLRVSPLLLVAKALLLAVARHPMINSSWDEDAQEIVVKHYVNLGIAAATERGLVVPNIKDAHALSLPGAGRGRWPTLAATARDGQDHAGRPGRRHDHDHQRRGVRRRRRDADPHPGRGGDPRVRPGQGRRRGCTTGELAVRQVTTLSLSFDHRIVDGDLGSAVLRDVGAMLADPVRMLAWS